MPNTVWGVVLVVVLVAAVTLGAKTVKILRDIWMNFSSKSDAEAAKPLSDIERIEEAMKRRFPNYVRGEHASIADKVVAYLDADNELSKLRKKAIEQSWPGYAGTANARGHKRAEDCVPDLLEKLVELTGQQTMDQNSVRVAIHASELSLKALGNVEVISDKAQSAGTKIAKAAIRGMADLKSDAANSPDAKALEALRESEARNERNLSHMAAMMARQSGGGKPKG